MDIEVHTDVEIGTVPSGPHRGAVTLDGAIHIPRGRLNIQGQRFDIDHGDRIRHDPCCGRVLVASVAEPAVGDQRHLP